MTLSNGADENGLQHLDDKEHKKDIVRPDFAVKDKLTNSKAQQSAKDKSNRDKRHVYTSLAEINNSRYESHIDCY